MYNGNIKPSSVPYKKCVFRVFLRVSFDAFGCCIEGVKDQVIQHNRCTIVKDQVTGRVTVHAKTNL